MSDLDRLKAALDRAHADNDPRPLAELEHRDLMRLKLAEEILEARFQAKKRANRIATISQMLVGWVALLGFFANAYQNHNNKRHLQEQSEREQKKWQQEFERARTADLRRGFFDTNALVTDEKSADRRLVGYALLEEFVEEHEYGRKAVVILEESLSKELRGLEASRRTDPEAFDMHLAAIQQIIRSLSASTSCDELVRAAGSVDRVTAHARKTEGEEAEELFALYARRLVGRAVTVCKDLPSFETVRQPVRDALGKLPWLLKSDKKPPLVVLNAAIANLLVEECDRELSEAGSSNCPEIRRDYLALCDETARNPVQWALEKDACARVREWPEPLPPEPTAPTDADAGVPE